MYITKDRYTGLYGPIDETVFNRLEFDACRVMDRYTTGIDGIKKLRKYFPVEEDAKEAVEHCAAKLINLLDQIGKAEEAAALGRGYTQTEQGLQRKIISRVESGNEAVSYSETRVSDTSIDAAVADRSEREKLLADTVREWLSGVTDSNGVNILYMGAYPWRTIW